MKNNGIAEKSERLKKTGFPNSNTKRESCRPAMLNIGESLSAYLQADFNITP